MACGRRRGSTQGSRDGSSLGLRPEPVGTESQPTKLVGTESQPTKRVGTESQPTKPVRTESQPTRLRADRGRCKTRNDLVVSRPCLPTSGAFRVPTDRKGPTHGKHPSIRQSRTGGGGGRLLPGSPRILCPSLGRGRRGGRVRRARGRRRRGPARPAAAEERRGRVPPRSVAGYPAGRRHAAQVPHHRRARRCLDACDPAGRLRVPAARRRAGGRSAAGGVSPCGLHRRVQGRGRREARGRRSAASSAPATGPRST